MNDSISINVAVASSGNSISGSGFFLSRWTARISVRAGRSATNVKDEGSEKSQHLPIGVLSEGILSVVLVGDNSRGIGHETWLGHGSGEQAGKNDLKNNN